MDLEERTRRLELGGQRRDFRLDALDAWRRDRVDPALVRVQDQLDGLVKADEIAEAVAKKMSDGRRIRLTRAQTAFAILSVLAAWSAPVIALVAHA